MSDDELFRAAQRGDVGTARRCLEQLLQEGAPLDVFRLVLRVAIWNDHGELVGEIVRLVTHAWTGRPYRGMLGLAARRGSTAAAHVLIQCGAFSGLHIGRALQWAATFGHAATAALLIPHAASASSLRTALAAAAADGPSRCVRVLIRCRADVNARCSCVRWAPLHEAANRGRTRVVKQLLYCKATVDGRSLYGRTPLDLAIQARHFATASVLRRFAEKENKETTA